MADSAEVHSLEVLREFRAALVGFQEDARLALQDVDFEIRRTFEWLSNEQRLYWQGEIRRGQQKLAQAKTELHRKKLARFADRRPDTSQEEKAVKRAERRLELSQKKLERVKRWVPELQHAVQEYRGRSQALADVAEMLIPRQLARLDRMIVALEEYAQVSAPRSGDPASGGWTAGTGAASGRDAESAAGSVGPEGAGTPDDPRAEPATGEGHSDDQR